jgi:hypothetical protein
MSVSLFTRNRLGAVDESRRYRHPEGFSIVVPRGWDAQLAPSGLLVRPLAFSGPAPRLDVMRLTSPKPADAKTREVTFQGRPAQLLRGFGDQRFIYQIQFERNGAWYALVVRQTIDEEHLAGPWRAFFDTFRLEPTAGTEPSTSTVSAAGEASGVSSVGSGQVPATAPSR